MDPAEGGVSQAVRTLCSSLTSRGIYNEVVSLDDPNSAFLIGMDGVTKALGPSKGPWRYAKTLQPWLRQNVTRFDAVIMHGLWIYTTYAVNNVIQSIKQKQSQTTLNLSLPRVYVMPHGMLDPYFQKATGRKLKAIRNWLYWKLIESKVVNNADGILFTCEMEMELARQPFRPYKPIKEWVVGLGVATPPKRHSGMDVAFRKKCPQLKDEPYILFLSRIHNKKGVDLLLAAFESVYSHLNDLNDSNVHIKSPDKIHSGKPLKIVIAGPGLDTHYGQKISQAIANSNLLSANVFVTGMISGDEKWGAFYGCSAFVLPSHQENFGIAVVEALACKKPVLISNQVNIWREIESEHGGIVENDTLEGTKQLLLKWSKFSAAQQDEMSENAGRTYLKYFAIDAATTRTSNAIAQV